MLKILYGRLHELKGQRLVMLQEDLEKLTSYRRKKGIRMSSRAEL